MLLHEGVQCFDQLKDDDSLSKALHIQMKASISLLVLYIYFYTLFVYTALRVCILTSRSLACFPQCVFVITTGASIFVAGPQHQQSSLSWSSTSNSSGCVNMGPLVAFAFSSASAPQRGTSPFTWLQVSGFFVSRLHHEGSPPWPGRWAPGTAA